MIDRRYASASGTWYGEWVCVRALDCAAWKGGSVAVELHPAP